MDLLILATAVLGALLLAGKFLARNKSKVERRLGIVWGRVHLDGLSPNGYPFNRLWICVAPAHTTPEGHRFDFMLSIRSWGFYVGRHR